jgi:hypothetical protein
LSAQYPALREAYAEGKVGHDLLVARAEANTPWLVGSFATPTSFPLCLASPVNRLLHHGKRGYVGSCSQTKVLYLVRFGLHLVGRFEFR